MVKKINVKEYIALHKNEVKDYVNVEELKIVGKTKVVTNMGRELMYVVLENKYGTQKFMSPDVLEHYYKKDEESGMFKYNSKKDGGDSFFAKCKALAVTSPVRFNATNGETHELKAGDFILLYKSRMGDIKVTGMDMLEFAETFAPVKKARKRRVVKTEENINE